MFRTCPLILLLFLLTGCVTSETAKPVAADPIRIYFGMPAAELRDVLGEPVAVLNVVMDDRQMVVQVWRYETEQTTIRMVPGTTVKRPVWNPLIQHMYEVDEPIMEPSDRIDRHILEITLFDEKVINWRMESVSEVEFR